MIASLALCVADVSHLGVSRTYLPPASGASGYSSTGYSSYPSYTGSGAGYYSGTGLGYNSAYNTGYNSIYTGSGGYNSGYSSNYGTGSGYSSGSYPVVTSGTYGSSYATAAAPQYRNYATPSRTYLPASVITTGYSSGLDTKYGSNGGYIY